MSDMAEDESGPARYSRRAVLGAMAASAAVAGVAGAGIATAVDDGAAGEAAKPAPTFDRTAVTPLPRSQHATALLTGGLVLCIGGVSPDGTLASCQVYDPDKDEWYDAAPLARPRAFHSATPMADGKVLVLGGLHGGDALSLASVFDPATDEWTRSKPLATPRYNHAATPLPDGRVVLTGGFHLGPLTTAEIYEPES